MLRLFFLSCMLLAWLLPTAGQTAGTLYPGFKTLGLWQDTLRVDLNVWYPSSRRPAEISYGPWLLQVSRNGREVEGRFPLILLSHGSSGTRFSHHETAALLARSGFVVAALTHSEDNANNMPHLFSLRQITDRIGQLRSTLDVLLTHPEISQSIDPQRVGLMGFGTGATAALLMGGALPRNEEWNDYCAKAGPQDPYCSAWALPRMRKLAAELPLKASLADVRIKSVAAVAPAYGMLFTKESLHYFYPPLLLIRADRDEINRAPFHADALAQNMPKPPVFTAIPDIDAASLMSACPPTLRQDIPELCGKASENTRKRAHKELNASLIGFFLKNLGDIHNVPIIPPPPDLTPRAVPKTEVKIAPAPENKKGRRNEGRNRNTARQR